MVANAPTFSVAFKQFTDWCLNIKDDVMIYAWSNTDHSQVMKEIQLKQYKLSEEEHKLMEHGFTNATDAADYLVNHGVPFRDAHGIVGQLVLLCIDKQIPLDDLSLEEYKKISPVFEEDIYEAISMKTCVEKRNTIGAPGHDAMEKVIAINDAYLADLK